MIDTPAIRECFAEKIAKLTEDGALSPGTIGQDFVDLHHQSRNAWSFDIELRHRSEDALATGMNCLSS